MKRQASWLARACEGRLVGPDVVADGTVTTDSREVGPGGVYVARRGENADGHDFAARAVDAGAVLLVVEHPVDAEATQIVVPDSTRALGDIARAHLADLRENGPLRVLAVTGSAGKTTTKDLLAQLLGAQGPTVAPRLSFNNEVGVPLTVLEAEEDTRWLVLEMGASGPGHIAYLTRIAPPDVAIELMVGTAHLGGFGSREGVALAKAELVEALTPAGTAVLNWDDTRVRAMAGLVGPGAVRFFAEDDGDADPVASRDVDVWARDITVDPGEHASFTLCAQGERVRVSLELVGRHHVHNALAAATAALGEGLTPGQVAEGLGHAGALSPHRMDVRTVSVDGGDATLIDDSYNANLDSMRAALTALRAMSPKGRAIAVLGEMLELGEASGDIHHTVGRFARDVGVDVIIALGKDAGGYVAASEGSASTYHVQQPDEVLPILAGVLRDSDVVLVKGSNGSGAWKVADALTHDDWRSRE